MDYLFCMDCVSKVSIRANMYEILKVLNRHGDVDFDQDDDGDITIKFTCWGNRKGSLSIWFDKESNDHSVSIYIGEMMIYSVARRTPTIKTILSILEDHSPLFGYTDYQAWIE